MSYEINHVVETSNFIFCFAKTKLMWATACTVLNTKTISQTYFIKHNSPVSFQARWAVDGLLLWTGLLPRELSFFLQVNTNPIFRGHRVLVPKIFKALTGIRGDWLIIHVGRGSDYYFRFRFMFFQNIYIAEHY